MNIYDIAEIAGVSIATVSRVVNGSPNVSEKTRQKVMAVIEKSNYTPNIFARGLGLDSMKTIGILCPDISDAYMSEAVSILEKGLHNHGYDCILGCSGDEREMKVYHTELLLSKRIDALIMVGSAYAEKGEGCLEAEYVRQAAEKVPVFLINGYVEGENIYCFYGDDRQGAYDVTAALIRRGKRRILFLSDSHTFSARQKMEGYEAALSEAGYPILGDLKFYARKQVQYVKEMLLMHKTLEFDSVFACNDTLAVGVLKYAKAKGIKIPEDLSVTGYNNSKMAVCCEPELTSVDNKVEILCNKAVDGLIRVLEGEKDVRQDNKIVCEIVKRCTTDF
ncbi:LacI family DNA-binding transcriptional regulator [Mediterraneibacter agrestimuris]|uniref:LacI family DNA-binding transcriptional regulator n=1 Tax=Mediterraneibacter agrestimuris TaxID=2941333 RepID=UPI00203A8620|nr:LacI family DNA-binding transcriptional regulator [Mediterraneibacter agrestimuris]